MHLWRNWQTRMVQVTSPRCKVEKPKFSARFHRTMQCDEIEKLTKSTSTISHFSTFQFPAFSIFEIFSFLLSFLFELTHRLIAVCIYCGLSEMLHLGRPRRVKFRGQKLNYAPVAELADAYGSGPYF